jgi:hypothetical protein
MGYFLSLSKSWTSFALNCSELLLLIFGVILVAGLVGEYRIRESSPWFKRCELLVIIGVLGELLSDGAIFTFSRHLETLSDIEVATLNVKASEANKAAGEANERASKEATARVAMLGQLKPRDFSQKQMDDFVATVNGRVPLLHVFTSTDPEASMYGLAVIRALENAHVKVVWHRTASATFVKVRLSSTGLTMYENPSHELGPILMEAFGKAGQVMEWFAPHNEPPVPNVPSPSLLIALKPIPLSWIPEPDRPPALKTLRPPWDPK